MNFLARKGTADKCSFYIFFCDEAILAYIIIAGYLLILPFAYQIVKLLRRNPLDKNSFSSPGIHFCGAKIIQSLSYIFSMLILRTIIPHQMGSTPARLHSTLFILNAYALAIYCSQISKILIAFNFRVGKVLYYITESIKYYFMLMISIGTVLTFIEFKSSKGQATSRLYQLIEFNRYLQNFLYALSVLLLSIVFVFSNVTSFMPDYIRKRIVIVMFLFCFLFILGSCINDILDSLAFDYLMRTKGNIYKWVYVIMAFFRYFLADLNLLAIINYLSITDEEIEKKEKDTPSEELFLQIQV